MIILALDTSTEQLALALARVHDDGGYELLATHDEPAPRRANTQLVPNIDTLMASCGLTASALDRVACGRGPGSFTGVRIGIATAKGIATGLHVPLHGISTLDAIAWRVHASGYRGDFGVVDDAMRGEVYPVRYSSAEKGPVRQTVDSVAKPDVISRMWAEDATGPMLVCGDGLKKYGAVFAAAFEACGKADLLTLAEDDLNHVSGEGLVAAFCDASKKNMLDSGDAGALLPLYTRLSDAEENERKRSASESVPKSGVADERAIGGLILRPLSRRDVPSVAAVERAAFIDGASGDAWSEGMLEDELGREDRIWWVASEGGEIVACCGGWVVDGTVHILDVAVVPERRNEGIAERLVRRVAHDALDLGATRITLEVRVDNKAAQALYSKLGLEEEGIRPHYYPGGIDACIMSGDLPLARSTGARRAGAAGGTRAAVAGMEVRDSVVHVDTSSEVHPLILAIETSCDETAAALIDGAGNLHSDVLASQIDFHARFGGVVPEIASRKHTEAIVGVVEEALLVAGRDLGNPQLDFRDLDAIAVTTRPGLVGALVVGLAFAKGLAWVCDLLLIEVDHLEGHIYASRLITPDIEPPMIALLVSGGHTMLVHAKAWGEYEILGETLDDAVGEAFDKVAKALGLGYPGGPILSKLAKDGNPRAIDFPRAMLHSGDLKFSLSGLKTAVITYIRAEEEAGRALDLRDLAASFQQAVIDVQVAKALTAVKQTGASEFCLGGGVAANPALRDALRLKMEKQGVRVTLPSLSACTDNAGMIAAVGLARYDAGRFSSFDCDALAHGSIDVAY
ncbi:MAG: tRNA (adenosine(37)-N6)-threonylcarbamoyltransferase complex transferase subunit TsaD [Actinobacteria bacterium]|nr:tRNA (adenosine(37)-N6)-threonylcarbamoyltransferase complex transferase subunit TsaD [Actinomycetota bacterium]